MSCGNHHDTSCDEVLDAVSAYLDGEITDHDHDRIAQHFDECGPCLHEFGIYQEVKLLVGRCCGGDQMPDEVRSRVVGRIRSVTLSLRADAAEA
jgi:anti-sigma factor (TIGR02949 family)